MTTAAEARPGIGRVIIKPIEEESTTITVNTSNENKERPQRGTIVNVGKVKSSEPEYEGFAHKGDVAVYGKYAGASVSYADGDHLVMFMSEIMSID